jgi:hypothetical protein
MLLEQSLTPFPLLGFRPEEPLVEGYFSGMMRAVITRVAGRNSLARA